MGANGGMRSTGSGTLTMGLLSVPVKLFKPTDPSKTGFHLYHKACGKQIQKPSFCEAHGVLKAADLERGLNDGDKVLIFSQEEIATLEADKDSTFDVQAFVPAESVPRHAYTGDTWFVGADAKTTPGKAFHLLREKMLEQKHGAVVKFTMRGSERVGLLTALPECFMLQDLYYGSELRSAKAVPVPPKVAAAPDESELMGELIASMAGKYDFGATENPKARQFSELLEKKRAGQPMTAPVKAAVAPATDLMAALKASLAAKKSKAA